MKTKNEKILSELLSDSMITYRVGKLISELTEKDLSKDNLINLKNLVVASIAMMYPVETRTDKAKTKIKEADKVANKRKRPKALGDMTTAFMKQLTPSPELAVIVGKKKLPRTKAVSKLWAYIKEHDLQSPRNKRNILCDDNLLKIFLKNEVSMFEISGIMSKHLS